MIILTISIALTSLVGCSTPITVEDGMAKLKTAVNNTLKYDYAITNDKTNGEGLFYWKEVVIDPNKTGNLKENETANVNLHANANTSEILLEGGEYVNYAARVERKVNSDMVEEVLVGDSKSSLEDGVVLPYIIRKQFDEKGKHKSSTKAEMTPEEYVQSSEFEQYKLSTKLYELSLLDESAFDFTVKGARLEQTGVTTNIKGKVTDEFLTKFEATHGYASMFEGTLVEIELAYERVAKIVVYDKEVIEDSYESTYESYKFEVVYLGKNVWIPSYDDVDMKYVK